MKPFLVLLLVVALSMGAQSKERYVMAQIILNNNDTIVNPILYNKLFDFQDYIVVKNDDGSSRKILPNEAKCFYVLTGKSDTLLFESNCGLRFGLSDNVEENCYFMLKMRKGTYPLYYFAIKKLSSVGTTMKTIYLPCYLTKFREDWLILEENNYVDQLIKLLKPLKASNNEATRKKLTSLEDKFRFRVYRFDDIPTGIDTINRIIAPK